ncbi:MAG: hypothetical protein JSW58_08155 [Candidatus Latescibacterota bacterium]|nr:MAG: hypothetical protein JSW58_08155 [Candidatus Latescibacterota bacterium]
MLISRNFDLEDAGFPLLRVPPIAWNEGGDAGGGGASPGGSGDDGGQGGGDSGGDSGGPSEGKGDAGGDGSSSDYVTPDQLKGVLEASRRQTQGDLEEIRNGQKTISETLTALNKRLDEMGSTAKPGKKKEEGGSESQEVVELRRKMAEFEEVNRDLASRAEAAESQRRDYEFETKVKASLVKAGCTNPDAAYLVAKPMLNHAEDGRVFATVKSQFGQEDVELDDWVVKHFSESTLPQLFKGKMRGGSPADGDAGGGGGAYDFTKEQILDDPEAYAADPEKARRALEQGRVKGVARPQ